MNGFNKSFLPDNNGGGGGRTTYVVAREGSGSSAEQQYFNPQQTTNGSSTRRLMMEKYSSSQGQGGQQVVDQESLARAVVDLNRANLRNQELLLQALQNLQATVQDLVYVKAREEDSEDDDDDEKEESKAESDLLSVERATVRLDGLEVYAVVAALTVATSITCFDSHGGNGQWGDLYTHGKYGQLLGYVVFLLTSALGLVGGMHATLVFSLMTMYGRTAVGIGKDEAFLEFFEKTGMVRYRGFQSFRLSLYSFLLQVLFMITAHSPPSVRWLCASILTYLVYLVYFDTQMLIATASAILFAPPPPKPTTTSPPKNNNTTSSPTSSPRRGTKKSKKKRP